MAFRPALLAAVCLQLASCYQVTPLEIGAENETLALLARLTSGPPSSAAVFDALAYSVPDWQKMEPGATLLQLWKEVQSKLGRAFQDSFRSTIEERRLRTLVVMPVGRSNETLSNFGETLQLLDRDSEGDTFHFALFHYHGQERWREQPWYEDRRIVLRKVQPGCKAQFWIQVSEALARSYDYLWLLDDDISLSTFSWPLYRKVLLALDPLVSQPAIVGKDVAQRSSDFPCLRMQPVGKGGSFSIARQVQRTEIQAPFISSRLWPALLQRLRGNDLSSAWYVSDFWDIVAWAAAKQCGKTGAVVVDASPLRHLNKHNLLASGAVGRENHCSMGCGKDGRNCEPLKVAEKEAIARSLKGFCPLGPEALQCWGKIRRCRKHMAEGQDLPTWGVKKW